MPTLHFTLAQIEAFACVCETKNLSVAAKRLQKSRTTVTELIDSLEINLGYKLFDKSKRPLQLTLEGKQLYTRARLFLHDANMFDQLAMQMPFPNKQTITLCYDCFTPATAIKALLHQFDAQHIKLNLLNMERPHAEQLLMTEQADIAIYAAANRSINTHFKWGAMGMVELGIYAHKDFFANTTASIPLSELASSNQLIPFIQLPEHLNQVIKLSETSQQITDIALLKELLNSKKGWCFLPTHLFSDTYKEIKRFHSELGNKGMMISIVILWKPTANIKLQQVIQQIMNHIRL